MQPRFYAQQEPDGTWTVYDRVLGTPATILGAPLVNLQADEAADLSEIVEALGGETLVR